jgi:ADP-heptose:LPS heptosyltransferase
LLRNVLAIRLDNIGDVLMLGPSLRAMRAAMPAARITLMTSRAGAQATPLLPWIDNVLVHRAAWQQLGEAGAPDVEEQLLLAEALAEHDFDAAFIFTSFGQSPYPAAHVAYLAGIPVRVGQSAEWGGQMLTHLVRPLPDDAHQVDRNLHLLESVGIDSSDRTLEMAVPLSARRDATRLLEEAGIGPGGYFVVAPGASCAARRWPLPRFAQAASLLRERTGLPVVVAGSAKETADAEQLARAAGRGLSVAGRTSIASLAGVIRGASLLVCNDSAPMHLAEAAGTPMVVTFSGTELRSQFAPRTAPAIVLGRMTPCTPCHRFECDRHLRCLDITADEVARAGAALLRHDRHHDIPEPVREVANA